MNRALALLSCLSAAMSLAGCATPRDRITSALVEAGVPRAPAECFSADITTRLSDAELRAIGTAVAQVREQGRSLTLADALELARDSGDARTAGILLTAAARCA
ncbi:hypothetical protein [Brevundimonas sp. R86498]|uniref:hypothetical protein n=1 Tax=Brevundimonas sp. R86498 TaxID=3093845 RepID=UPI0037C72F10